MKYIYIVPVVLLLICTSVSAQIKMVGSIKVEGKVKKKEDISAVVYMDKMIVVGSDETTHIQILKLQESNGKLSYIAGKKQRINLLDSDEEVDIEGIAHSGNTFYIVGSHSLKRKKVKADKTYNENRERLETIVLEESKNNIFRLDIDAETGKASSDIMKISVKDILSSDPVIGVFTNIPSKENGVDIEGIAVDNNKIYLGFRGPVLRLNYVPIMMLTFDNPKDYKLVYVNLGGQGIRDIVKVKDGFLIIGGPVGDKQGVYQLWHWNGLDCIPDENIGKKLYVTKLGEIPTPNETKAEGIDIIEETDDYYKVIIVYDGAEYGSPTLFEVSK